MRRVIILFILCITVMVGYDYVFCINQDITNEKYLKSIQFIEADNKKIIKVTEQITAEAKTEEEKVNLIYAWITKNIKYDYAKYYRQVYKNDYEDFLKGINYGALNTLKTRKGVCYDISCLMAAMCRSQKIYCQVVWGDVKNKDHEGIHNWNAVYIDNKWIEIDATFKKKNEEIKTLKNMYLSTTYKL